MPTKAPMIIFGKSIPTESVKWNFFINWKNKEIVKFLIKFYSMWDFTEDLASFLSCQNEKHKIEVKTY